MVKSVHTNLEVRYLKHLPQGVGHAVLALGNKIERGAKSAIPLQLGQRFHPRKAFASLNIVGQNYCELFAMRPSGPSGWGGARTRIDGPNRRIGIASVPSKPSPQSNADAPWQVRFKTVVGFVQKCIKHSGDTPCYRSGRGKLLGCVFVKQRADHSECGVWRRRTQFAN